MVSPVTTVKPPYNGNPGIVPPWLQKPPPFVPVLPVEPEGIRHGK